MKKIYHRFLKIILLSLGSKNEDVKKMNDPQIQKESAIESVNTIEKEEKEVTSTEESKPAITSGKLDFKALRSRFEN